MEGPTLPDVRIRLAGQLMCRAPVLVWIGSVGMGEFRVSGSSPQKIADWRGGADDQLTVPHSPYLTGLSLYATNTRVILFAVFCP